MRIDFYQVLNIVKWLALFSFLLLVALKFVLNYNVPNTGLYVTLILVVCTFLIHQVSPV